ncbi:hypothetical protein [Maridesulfovibrio sp. FT414]|uniref:hypothetical protein n=1 Tax=Maridesulfovibrio sp. FT414 TaxID=2979469 RepID=UPI003D807F49
MSEIVPQYQLGVDCAVVLGWRTGEEAIVKGLNKIGLPEMSRDVISIDEFRRDFAVEFTTGGKFGRVSFSGYTLFSDNSGQDRLKQYLLENKKFKDCVIMLNAVDFMALDLANDPEGVFQVSKAAPGETDKNGVFSFTGELVCGGRVAYYTKHMTAATIGFEPGTSGAKDTITDSANGFIDAGFAAGQSLIVHGSAANSGHYLIKEVAAGVITLECSGKLTSAVAGDSITLDSGKL